MTDPGFESSLRRSSMFARFVELTIKSEKKTEFLKTFKEEIVPVLRKNTGFFDLIPLQVEIAPNKFYAISLWKTKFDVEKYEKEFYPRVKQILEPFLTSAPVVTFCTVEETVREKVAAVAA